MVMVIELVNGAVFGQDEQQQHLRSGFNAGNSQSADCNIFKCVGSSSSRLDQAEGMVIEAQEQADGTLHGVNIIQRCSRGVVPRKLSRTDLMGFLSTKPVQ